MAKSFDKNTVYATTAAAIFALKALLKAQGWTVKSSGDGLSAFSSSGDIITGSGSGANGMNNALAWFRIQDPGGVREFVWQRANTSAHHWWTTYSAQSKFTGGSPSATARPTATDGQNFIGTNTTGLDAFLGGGGDGTFRFQMMADSSAPYTWYILAYSSGGSTCRGCYFMDSLQSGSYDAADTDPVVLGAFTTGTGMFNNATATTLMSGADKTPGNDGLFCWYKYGLTGATYVSMGACAIVDAGNIMIPGGLPVNAFTSKDEVFAPMVGRYSTRTQPQFKGVMQNMRYVGPQRALSGDTLTVVSTKDYIIQDKSIAFPWDGTDPSN